MRPFLLCCWMLSFALGSASAQDAKSQQTAEIQRQIALLNHQDYATREAATVKLGQMGLPALPLLLDALKHRDLELAARALRAVRLVCSSSAALPAPTGQRLTIQVGRIDARLAIKILSKTTGYRVALDDDVMSRPIQLSLSNASYFAALRAICKAGRYEYQMNGSGRMSLRSGSLVPQPTAVSGPFMLQLTKLERIRQVDFRRPAASWMSVSFKLSWESRVRLLEVRRLQLERATDDLGNDLLRVGQLAGLRFQYRESMLAELGYAVEPIQRSYHGGQVRLAACSRRATEIARLSGHVWVGLGDVRELRIPLSAKAAARRRVFKGGYFELVSVERVGDKLIVRTRGKVPVLMLGGRRQAFWQLSLIQQSGAAPTWENWKRGRGDDSCWLRNDVYRLEAGQKLQAIGLKYVSRIVTRKVAFDFSNISLK